MVVLTLLIPLLLLAFLLLMERVERPLRDDAVGDQLAQFMEVARPEELEVFVKDGFAPTVDRYWRRRRIAERLQVRSYLVGARRSGGGTGRARQRDVPYRQTPPSRI